MMVLLRLERGLLLVFSFILIIEISADGNQPEVHRIIYNGDPQNRIDIVFMGDGYTKSEKNKFFGDINRFVEEIFTGVTFKSFLPVFNIWAIYVESLENGIGYGYPKNTPFKLYREKGKLRGIFTANVTFARKVCNLTGSYACDFPVLMGNDDYYGGLGGELVIFTRSKQTGKFVLEHELGHSFLSAGEEYDNGYSYFGVNSAQSLDNLRWRHWLSGEKREERSIYRILLNPWKNLQDNWLNYTFISDGNYNQWEIIVSVTGADEDDSIKFLLDGKILSWKSTGSRDRVVFSWSKDHGFSNGLHYFAIKGKRTWKNYKIPTMICSIAIYEFGNENEYHKNNKHISAYPTWDKYRRKTYRPTNGGCLMRNVTYEHFCPVCQEGIWINFLSKLSLIDEVDVRLGSIEGNEYSTLVTLRTLQLGQFRSKDKRITGEFLEIKWYKNNIEQIELENLSNIIAMPGLWNVSVKFITDEVRKDPNGCLISYYPFLINSP